MCVMALGTVVTRAQSSAAINGCYDNTNGMLRRVASAADCRPNETPISWDRQGAPGAGGLNGTREFTESATFAVPSNVTRMFVELWGGGGGGQAGHEDLTPCERSQSSITWVCNGFGPLGAGGGSGAYVRSVISVTPGATYHIVIGSGGAEGTGNAEAPGVVGADTEIRDASGALLLAATGGSGGDTTRYPTGAPGGSANLLAMISRAGVNGATSGNGGSAVVPQILPGVKLGTGGNGGRGGGNVLNPICFCPAFVAAGPGSPGAPGYALIVW
jgi:hypothetical protein